MLKSFLAVKPSDKLVVESTGGACGKCAKVVIDPMDLNIVRFEAISLEGCST